MIARTGLKRITGPLLVLLLGLAVHILGLYVAPLRTELRDVELAIQAKKRQIAYLEAEFSARASVERLSAYNDVLYGYEPPRADQFLAGENAMASLGGDQQYGPPVMISVAAGPDGVDPAGIIGSFTPQLSDIADVVPDLSLPVDGGTDADGEKAGDADAGDTAKQDKKPSSAKALAARIEDEGEERAARDRGTRLASLDRQLLSDATLRSISVQAEKERSGP